MAISSDKTPTYKIGDIEVSIDAGNRGPGNPVEFGALVTQLDIFQNLGNPYVTARIMYTDSANFSNAVNILGQEKVTIIMKDTEGQDLLKKDFFVTSLELSQKVGDDKSVNVMNLAEEHLLLNNSTRFSKTYEGKPSDICNNICFEQLGINVTVSEPAEQKEMRVIIPYTMTPLNAAQWMAKRCTTKKGIPYLFYSKISEQNELNLDSLFSLLNEPAVNENDPIVFGTLSYADGSSGEDDDKIRKKITNYTIKSSENSLLAMIRSMYGGYYNWVNTIEDMVSHEYIHSLQEDLGKVPKPNGENMPYNYDPEFSTMGGRPYHEGQNTYTSQITTGKLFEPTPLMSYAEEKNPQDHMNKVTARTLFSFLDQQPIDITLPASQVGFGFDVLGKIVEIEIPKDLPITTDENAKDTVDKKRSGKYLVCGLKHTVFGDVFNVVMTLTKIDTDPALGEEKDKLHGIGQREY